MTRPETGPGAIPDAMHDRWTRRVWLGGAAAVLANPWPAAWAQPVSAAAEEAKAPPLPALGSELKLPRISLLDGSVFEPAPAEGKPLLVT